MGFWDRLLGDKGNRAERILSVVILIFVIAGVASCVYYRFAGNMDKNDAYDIGFDMGRRFGFNAASMGD